MLVDERRRTARRVIEIDVTIRQFCARNGVSVRARIDNVSEGGIHFLSPVPFLADSQVLMIMKDFDAPKVPAILRILRCDPTASGYDVGARFEHLHGSYRKVLRNHFLKK